MSGDQRLVDKLDSMSELGGLDSYMDLPDYITKNLNEKISIREYQKKAIARLVFYLSDKNPIKKLPIHLLFHMATGSGKTLLMAANILYLYERGCRNFIFFVNSTTIIQKTKANFLDKSSPKYLFAESVMFDDKEVVIQEVDNFEGVNEDSINILFTTIQGLHSRMWNPQENTITFEDFENKEIVFLSDEAHHINAMTKKKLNKEEAAENTSWENTVNRIFQKNSDNIMLEYTATVELSHKAIRDKYADKIIYEYTLKEFREDKFSKDVHILQSDLELMDRALQAVILSQYRRKVAEKHKIRLKPVILIRSQKTIAQSQQAESDFKEMIKKIKVDDIKKIERSNTNGIITKAFRFFRDNKITYENLMREIKEDFSEEKCIAINSKEDSEDKQIKVNTLEDEHNEIRVVFTVNMLNEGWDVLNLFDIVRLYEKRDGKNNIVGKRTIAEAQLIGRGARYYPFALNEDDDRFKRKYDDDIDNELRVLEELHYHSLNDSRYITEIRSELVRSGIVPTDQTRLRIEVSIKDEIKETDFWKNGLIFVNKKQKTDRSKVKHIRNLITQTDFQYKLRTGKTTEIIVFDEDIKNIEQRQESHPEEIKFNDIQKHITRKALDKVKFYHFCNLKQYFPSLESIDEFLTSNNYLGGVTITVHGPIERVKNLDNNDKYEVSLGVFKQLAEKIEIDTAEYEGTKEFTSHSIHKLIPPSKTMEILVGGEKQELGTAMSDSTIGRESPLKDCKWYMYDENYGTSEEKYFVLFVRNAMSKLEQKYTNIYLLRNERTFKIYRFSDGKAFEPDFVLFLTEKNTKKQMSLQLFIEPKGEHLLSHDCWKEKFLEEIESHFEIISLHESDKYRLIGLPFYNEAITKKDFKSKFNEKLKLPQ